MFVLRIRDDHLKGVDKREDISFFFKGKGNVGVMLHFLTLYPMVDLSKR